MKPRVLVGAMVLSCLALGCADSSYYEEDDAAAAVTVTPLIEGEEGEEGKESGEGKGQEKGAPEAGPVARSSESAAREFVKAMPPNPRAGADGLERHRDWGPLKWDNPCTASVWKRSGATDDVVLVVGLEGGASDKAAVARKVELAFAESGTLRMDVYNGTSRGIPVAFAVFSSVDRVYSEAKPAAAPSGWSRLEFDLGASIYKTASSEWKYTARLWGPEDVREVVILFYDGGVATLALDRVEVDAEARRSKPEPTEEPAEERTEGGMEEPAVLDSH